MANTTVTNQDLYVLQEKIYLKIDAVETKVDAKYVTKDEFEPYKKLLQAITAAFITSLVGAFVYLIQKGGNL